MKKVGHLTYKNINKGFLESLKEGDIFTYSQYYPIQEVVHQCMSRGIHTMYMSPNTEEYKTFGCYCMKVTIVNKQPTLTTDILLTNEIRLTPEQLDTLLKDMFLKGEEWGVCYSTWMTPSEEDHAVQFDQAKKEVLTLFKNKYQDVL
jgi:hypothetical protein